MCSYVFDYALYSRVLDGSPPLSSLLSPLSSLLSPLSSLLAPLSALRSPLSSLLSPLSSLLWQMGMIRLQARTHARVAHGGRADVAGAHHNL